MNGSMDQTNKYVKQFTKNQQHRWVRIDGMKDRRTVFANSNEKSARLANLGLLLALTVEQDESPEICDGEAVTHHMAFRTAVLAYERVDFAKAIVHCSSLDKKRLAGSLR